MGVEQSLILGNITFILTFLVLALMLPNIYMQLMALMFMFAFDILLWGMMLNIAGDILAQASITSIISAGWPVVLYSHLVFIFLIFLWLFYKLLKFMIEVAKIKVR